MIGKARHDVSHKKRFIFTVLMHTHRGHPQIIGVMNIPGIPTAYALSLISTGKDIFAPIFISAAGSCVLV